MTKEIYEYSSVAIENDFPPADGGWPEGMTRSDVNNASRENLAAARRLYDEPEWIRARIQGPDPGDVGVFTRISATQFQISLAGKDLTRWFNDGRFILVKDGSGAGVDLLTQVSGTSTYADPVTTVNIKVSDSMDVAASDAYSYFSSIARGLSIVDQSDQFFIPLTPDSSGIQGAVDAADAAGGGLVLLIDPLYTIDATIDLSTKTGIRMLGSSPLTRLEQVAASNLDEMIDIGALNTVENFILDVNRTNNPTGDGYGITVDGVDDSSVTCVRFIDCEVGVNLTSSTSLNFIVERCNFESFRQFGIATTNALDIHTGRIDNCYFDMAGVTALDPGGAKVAGRWIIEQCHVVNCANATVTPRGLWLWNSVSVQSGGFRSVVTNCIVEAGTANPGIGIEAGATDFIVSGNVVTISTSGGTAIYVRGTAAGAPVTRGVVSSNTCAAEYGIRTTELTNGTTVVANSVAGSTSCIEIAGDNQNVASNVCQGGTDGIDVLATALFASIRGNQLQNQTGNAISVRGAAQDADIDGNRITGSPSVGISVSATAVDTFVFANRIDAGIATPLSNLSTTTRASGNDLTETNFSAKYTGNTSTALGSEFVIGSMSGLAIPGEVAYGRHRMWWDIDNNNAAVVTIRFRIGPLGTIADPIAHSFTIVASGNDTVVYSIDWHEQVVTGSTDLLTVTQQAPAGSNATVNHLYLEKMADE